MFVIHNQNPVDSAVDQEIFHVKNNSWLRLILEIFLNKIFYLCVKFSQSTVLLSIFNSFEKTFIVVRPCCVGL